MALDVYSGFIVSLQLVVSNCIQFVELQGFAM